MKGLAAFMVSECRVHHCDRVKSSSRQAWRLEQQAETSHLETQALGRETENDMNL